MAGPEGIEPPTYGFVAKNQQLKSLNTQKGGVLYSAPPE